ncbi:MAG: aspartate kinase [Clostridia bacterium]|nr:aspartate kinase [Clostridia bacterium]
MGLIVQKFGGTSVADRICIYNVANIIARRMKEGNQVVTVVSAQGDTTDHLLAKAQEISDHPSLRELDALIATGEQSSAALIAIALDKLGVPAISLNGAQAGIQTNGVFGNAEIVNIDEEKIRSYLAQGYTVIVTGFQGINAAGDITTLGRGGSDTSAVAIAAALNADSCRIYKDVDGIYTADPRKDPHAKKINHINYDDMLALCDAGSGVLQRRSVELAKKHSIELQILSSFQLMEGTIINEI